MTTNIQFGTIDEPIMVKSYWWLFSLIAQHKDIYSSTWSGILGRLMETCLSIGILVFWDWLLDKQQWRLGLN